MDNYLYIIDNTFEQSYIKNGLKILPLIIDDTINIDNIYDINILIYKYDKNTVNNYFIGYFSITDIYESKIKSMKEQLKKYDLFDGDDLYFIKFKEIIFFKNTIDINKYNELFKTNYISSNEILQFKMSLYPFNNIDTIINNISYLEIKNNNDVNNNTNKKFVYIKWMPCFDLIEHIENNKISYSKMDSHFNDCDLCIKDFNTINNITTIDFPFCFICYDDVAEVANNIINCYENNYEYKEINLHSTIPKIENNMMNIIYFKNCNKHYDNNIFVIL